MKFIKKIWSIIVNACREPPEFDKRMDDHEFCLWAFGTEYRSMSLHCKIGQWNELHNDILHLSCDAEIFDALDCMYRHYLDHLTPDPEIKHDST